MHIAHRFGTKLVTSLEPDPLLINHLACKDVQCAMCMLHMFIDGLDSKCSRHRNRYSRVPANDAIVDD